MRRFPALAIIVAMAAPQPALAQFGLIGDAMRGAHPTHSDPNKAGGKGCDTSKKTGARMFGSMLGGIASRTVGRTGMGAYLPLPEFASLLTDAIACKLEPKEQKQAATATETATRGGAVGSSSSWTSETRPGVSGTSTVASKTQTAGGGVCMTVNDVIIVSGEETTVSKKMCRAPGASGYTLAA